MKRVTILLASLISNSAFAGGFGVYDARSQAMGGAAVAVGSVQMATGHNPALFGLYNEDEDKSLNGHYHLPYAVANLSQVAIDSIQLLDDELDIAFDNALDNYNANPAPEAAALASVAAQDLENGLESIANKDITFTAFAPLIAVSEPAKKGGGGFYLGSRIEAGGLSNIPEDDIELFDDYVEALDNVAAGGYWRDVHPELFNADDGYVDFEPPPLNDPFDQIESNAELRGLVINEAVVAGALGFDMDRMRVAIGIAPKAMQIRVFDESREVSSNDLEVENGTKTHLMFNADIGLAVEFDSGFRLAYVGKDLITRSFEAGTGSRVKLSRKHRMGFAYIQPKWQVGLDYDMQQNEPLATEKTGQFLLFGGEYTLFDRIALRAGYRYDTKGQVAGLASVGMGARIARSFLNFSFATSSEEKGAGLQIGFSF